MNYIGDMYIVDVLWVLSIAAGIWMLYSYDRNPEDREQDDLY